ncbi:synaptic vesicle glycoprotein 2A-like isoform X2 [Phymastichus coffea]|uniref:synaptic vesicle glycoprotein 2A-like isoform X2 n=1 Tax=Phymastichus coffea TaxID=108790 RepID=UPI00273A9707|nr:synaptic vesicle glycoprotein 2A-like isoform X2 [Phymastichus coffea]
MLTEIQTLRRISIPWTVGEDIKNDRQQHPADYEKAIAETGMVIAGPLWDFVFQDVIISCYGKRNVMIMGLILDSVCNILWAHATTYYTFILFKFLNGILIAGPLSVLMPYLSEFHAPTYQPTFAKWAGVLFSISNILPPAISSLLILHTSWFNLTIFNRFYATWRIYMLICTIPPAVGILTVCLMPKSPKFLLTKGEHHEALRVFKMMYSMNKFESPDSFKISTLVHQQKTSRSIRKLCTDRIESSISNLRIALSKPYQKSFLIILLLQFSSMVGFNTMRLWVPQFFITLNNFHSINRPSYPPGEAITMCEMLFPRIENIDYASCAYTAAQIESAVYFNSMIIASATILFSSIFTFAANTRLRKVSAIIFSFLFPTVGSVVANWAIEIPWMLIFLSSIIVTMKIAANIIATYVADVTPTMIRPTVNHSLNFVGHIGAALGPILFSVVLGASCLTAFMEIGCLSFVCYILAFFLIKKPPENDKVKIERF